MAISNYSELQQAVSDWMARADLSGNAADFISLGEARLNRMLNPAETDATIPGTASSREIDVSSLAPVRPIALFLKGSSGEMELVQRAPGSFAFIEEAGCPRFWSLDGDKIVLDCLLSTAEQFRFRYQERFALSNTNPTNWLLTNHPDVYLAASLVWGGAFIKDGAYAASFKTLLDETIPEIRSQISQSRRGVLTVDPALMAMNSGRRGYV